MAVYPRQKFQELSGLLLLGACSLLLLALISYDHLDPAWNVASGRSSYHNYVGKVGAHLADLLFHFWGLAAFLLPFPLLLIGYRLLRGVPWEARLLKTVAFFFTLGCTSALLSLIPLPLPWDPNYVAGGVVGVLAADVLVRYLNLPGAAILLLTLLLASLLLTTRFSLRRSLLGGRLRPGLLSAPLRRLAEAFQEWRQRRDEQRRVSRLRRQPRQMSTQPLPRKLVLVEEPEEAPEPPPDEEETPRVRRAAEILPAPPPAPSETALPSLDFLQAPPPADGVDEGELIERSRILETKCAEFDVRGRVVQIHPGPVVTTFEFKPDPGVKYSRITNLADDLCLALKAESIRIDRIPGKSTVGIEVPNPQRQTIYLREILCSLAFQQSASRLTLGLGKLINGNTYVTDLSRMPHLLIAGATGAGKSVALNCMVCSILYKARPHEVRFLMIDPKRLELGVYEGIPHLLTPIVTDPKQAANALAWAVRQMEERYKLLARYGVRNIIQFNRLLSNSKRPLPEEDAQPLPFIVILVDELADLMMTAGKEVEASLTRLAQMARAIGIHLILATQRPSVDVLTGLIKANFPCRISFRVSSKFDSRTILDCTGAEHLLGQGDMLFLSPGSTRLTRIHGAFIDEKEIARVTSFLKGQGEPQYQEEILEGAEEEEGGGTLVEPGELEDDLYEEAARFVVETGKASTSLLQRRFRIGYGRAARLLDIMEHEGLVGPSEGSKAREVLVAGDYFREVEQPEDS